MDQAAKSEEVKKSPYISEAAYTYEPKEEDIFMKHKKMPQRMIFGGQEFLPDEKASIYELKEHLNKIGVSYERWDDELMLRHLQGNDFKLEETYKSLSFAQEWNDNNLERVNTSQNVQNLLNMGVMYWLGRDPGHRPVLIVNVNEIIRLKIDAQDLTDLCVYLVNWGIDNLLVPGRVQNWVIIINMKDVSTTKIPKDKLQPMVKLMQGIYRGRLNKMFAVYMPMLAYALWTFVKIFINKYTLDKINIQRGDLKPLQERVNKNQLEAKFGGQLPNVEDLYFPPKYMT